MNCKIGTEPTASVIKLGHKLNMTCSSVPFNNTIFFGDSKQKPILARTYLKMYLAKKLSYIIVLQRSHRSNDWWYLSMTKAVKQFFAKVSDDIVMVVHHDAEGLAQNERGPHHKVAPSWSSMLLHKSAEEWQRDLCNTKVW